MFDAYTSQVLTFIGINSLLALSLYITALAGQLSVGHAAFMGIGAYASTLLMIKLGFSFWLALPSACIDPRKPAYAQFGPQATTRSRR